MLSVTLKNYWHVSLLKNSPENTPHSNVFLFVFASLFFLVVISQWSMVDSKHPLTFNQIILAAFLLCVSYSAYTFILLKIYQLEVRFLQTLTSLFAVHVIIHIFAYPILAATPFLSDESVPGWLAFIIASLYLALTLLLTVWQIMVTYFIYQKALSAENIQAVFATIGLFVMNVLVVSLAG